MLGGSKMVELFQNVFALSLQIGLLIAIAVGIRRLGRKRYFAAGYYFFWMFLAVRLLFPMNMEWITLQETNPLVGRVAVQESVVDNEVQEYSEKFDNDVQQKMVQSQQEEGNSQTEEKELPLLQNLESQYKAVTDFQKNPKQGAVWKRWVSVIRDSENQIWKWSTAIWLIGMVGYGFYQILIYQSIYKKLKRWSRTVSKKEQQTFQNVKQEMGIKRKISVIQCSQIFSPMLIGLRNPTIILPEKGYDEQSLQFIYRHELTHFKHFDLYYKLLQTMVRSIYWFHPLVHLMYRKASFDMEIYCDEAVTKFADKKYCQAYSLVLLNALIEKESIGKVPLTTYLNGGKEHMKERFKHIMNRKNRKYGIVVFAILVMCAGILGNISLHSNIQAEQKEQVNQAKKPKDNAKNAKEVHAKEKKTCYYTSMSGNKSGIKKMKLKGNKLTIWGSFSKASSSKASEKAYYNGKKLKYKKRTFTLSKKVKFYGTGGTAGKSEYSKQKFSKDYVTQPDLGLGFLMVVKNGKVIKIYTMS